MPVYRLVDELIFPSPYEAEPDGLLAVGGDLRPERLLLAYSMGIFPWYSEGEPILWYSPAPRLILVPTEIHISRSLRRRLRQHPFHLTLDVAFGRVIRACAGAERPQGPGTWITSEMVSAYERLHELGFAHSVEVWEGAELAGGLYGISIGACFCGESMFSRRPDASKIALVTLTEQLARWGVELIDCQLPAPHLVRLGARAVGRRKFLEALQRAVALPGRRGRWSFDPGSERA